MLLPVLQGSAIPWKEISVLTSANTAIEVLCDTVSATVTV
jgi:hypothetical protein